MLFIIMTIIMYVFISYLYYTSICNRSIIFTNNNNFSCVVFLGINPGADQSLSLSLSLSLSVCVCDGWIPPLWPPEGCKAALQCLSGHNATATISCFLSHHQYWNISANCLGWGLSLVSRGCRSCVTGRGGADRNQGIWFNY